MCNKVLRLILINSFIVIINIILFSPGLMAIKINSSNVFASAIGITSIFMSIIIFFWGNYGILIERQGNSIDSDNINTIEKCEQALKSNLYKKTFISDINSIIDQIDRFYRKRITIIDILSQKFDTTEISYVKFKSVIKNIEQVFFINTKSIVNKITIFDEKEYRILGKTKASMKISQEIIDEKLSIFNQYILYINAAIEDNEEILLKFDKLLLELSNFNSLEDGELENMSAIKDIDDLISKIKLYK